MYSEIYPTWRHIQSIGHLIKWCTAAAAVVLTCFISLIPCCRASCSGEDPGRMRTTISSSASVQEQRRAKRDTEKSERVIGTEGDLDGDWSVSEIAIMMIIEWRELFIVMKKRKKRERQITEASIVRVTGVMKVTCCSLAPPVKR